MISVALAVERVEAKKLEEENKEKKIKEDKRNLYLAREGSKGSPLKDLKKISEKNIFSSFSFLPTVVRADSEAGKALPKAEQMKRLKAEQEKKQKLLNPNYFISKTRISVRSLPLTIDDKQ